MSRLQSAPPGPARAFGGVRACARAARRVGDALVLGAHRLAVACDATPAEFGAESPVDEADARAVRREWIRCLQLWGDYNPEEVFAVKVGAALLGLTLLGLWLLVALVR